MNTVSMVHSTRNQKLITGGGEMIGSFGKIGVKQSGWRYEVGDMVWGKVRSHPWWPGQIFHEALALPCVNKTKREGHVLVAFFGDNSYGWFDPFELVPFEINYIEKSKQTNDFEFVNAVKDAEDEVRRRAALGLSCQCCGTCNFQETDVKGLVEVDVRGHQPGGVYLAKHIKDARNRFHPLEMLCFLKKLAYLPRGNLERSINWIKNEAVVLAYRKAVFEEVDETYTLAYGAQPIDGENPIGTLNLSGQMPSKVHKFGSMNITLVPDPSGKENATLKKSVLKEISLIKPLVYREAEKVKNGDISQNFQQLEPEVSKAQKISCRLGNVQVVGRTSSSSGSVSLNEVIVPNSDYLDAKSRKLKCYGEDLHSKEILIINKKKRKKEIKSESGLDCKYNHLKNAKGESGNEALGTRSSYFMATGKKNGFRRINSSKLLQLISCLSELALNPFHTFPTTMLQFFLEFRSVVYKKVIVVPAAGGESIESSLPKSPSCSVTDRSPYKGTAQDLPSALKPPKKRLKSDDCKNVSLSGSIIDREEQISLEEPRRLNELKALTEEKKADNGRMNVSMPKKLTKHSRKKSDTSTRVTKPKMIVIQFPSQSALPSVSELKARFARFGQLHSPPRVIWKSSTCQVLFKSKSDAKEAYTCAIKNRSLFGSVKVEYYLQDVEPSATELPRPGKQLVRKATGEVLHVKSWSTGNESRKPRSIAPQHQPMQPNIQPNSCPKKQLNDEVTIVHDEEHNLQKFIPPFLLPHLPRPPDRISEELENLKFSHLEVSNMQYLQHEATSNSVHTTSNSDSSISQSINIYDEMLSLLMRCHEIVSDLKRSQGYVPLNL